MEQFALAVPVSRILINTPGAQGSMDMGIGLTPSSVPGCGTFVGLATSDIVCPTGLVHIKHVVSSMVLTSDQGNCM